MSDRLMVDLAPDGRVSVSVWLDGEVAPELASQPFELSWPLDANALEDLRWYLEDYLQAPFGVYGDRGTKVAARLKAWGEAIFGALFGSGCARDAYMLVRTRGVGSQVVLRSSSPALLGLPWELLADPTRPEPLALDGVDLIRSLPAKGLGPAPVASGERLRVLMVISRPGGPADVGYRMIARPLMERLQAVRGQVELVVLRPPTLEALEGALTQARAQGQPFQIVHFDGHGMLAGRGQTPGLTATLTLRGPAPEGVLIFERAGGGSSQVRAAVFAHIIKAAEVPVVILNACQSGAVGTEIEAAVATRLLQEGAASVVAMGYAVYAEAAAEFMAAFYERLFAGDEMAEAVGAGRRRLHQHPARRRARGKMPLVDWMVPVHYLGRDVSFPYLRSKGRQEMSLNDTIDRPEDFSTERHRDELQPAGSFIGRDGLFYELEVTARLKRVVILHGLGGTGKTELAKAFGRWWRDSGGVERPEWVIWHSFEPGVASFGLDAVVSDIGLRVFGTDFARVEVDRRRQVVEQLLAERRLLLIWDNFESVSTMPDPAGATPPLDEAGRQELRALLRRLARGGASAVIVTSRTDEAWLGDLHRIPVDGLAPGEAVDYADELLAPCPGARPRRAKRAFGELLEWLGGHPLSMRLVLPHLQTTEPEQVLAALRGLGELPGVAESEGKRTTSLAASVNYSLDHVNPTTRRLLVAACLFHDVAIADVLAAFSQIEGTPRAFRGVSRQNWVEALDAAAWVGLLTPMGAGMYRIHPALPAYLAARWRSEDPEGHDAQRDAATRALLTVYAAFARLLHDQIGGGHAGAAFRLIEQQRRTLGHLLGYALGVGLWEETKAIAEPLNEYWNARGQSEEARGWVDRARVATEGPRGALPGLDTPAGALWLLFVGSQANRDEGSGQLDAAEDSYRQILTALENQPPSPFQRQHLARTYNNLGTLAQQRGHLEGAENWCLRSLAIKEELGDRRGMATTYHQLGLITKNGGRLDEAEAWYLRSLRIREELGDRLGMVDTYENLGALAQDRGRLDEAVTRYLRSLRIREELGDRLGMAHTYHNLGIVSEGQYRLDEAEAWYRRSLVIEEDLGDRRGVATTYHQLGMVALERGNLDDAEAWLRRALVIKEELGDRPGTAKTYDLLGMAALERGNLDDAEAWSRRALGIQEELGGRRELATTYHQLGMVARYRGHLDEAEAWSRLALGIQQELGDRPGMAGGYHLLGLVALDRGHLDEAEAWSRRALGIQQELGDRPGMAMSYGSLGGLAMTRGRHNEALECIVRCVALFEEFPHPATYLAAAGLAWLTETLGVDALAACWLTVTGSELPRAVRDFIQSHGSQDSTKEDPHA